MPYRKIAKIVGAAFRDADLARKTSADPKWQKEQMQDRRGTLRKFETVEHALQDREKTARATTARAESAKSKSAKSAKSKTTKAKKK